MDIAVDSGAHGDDGVEGQAVKLGKLRQQIDGVESGAEQGHGGRTHGHAANSALAGFADMIEDGCGQHQTAANHEVGKVSHEGGGGALEQELQQNLDPLAGNRGGGA